MWSNLHDEMTFAKLADASCHKSLVVASQTLHHFSFFISIIPNDTPLSSTNMNLIPCSIHCLRYLPRKRDARCSGASECATMKPSPAQRAFPHMPRIGVQTERKLAIAGMQLDALLSIWTAPD